MTGYHHRRDWSHLPEDVLRLIYNKLEPFLPDMKRFSLVCRSWSSLHSLPSGLFLIAPGSVQHYIEDEEEEHNYHLDGNLELYNLGNGVTYKAELPELLNQTISCVSCGWMITVGENSDMQLLHPFSRKVIKLPPISNLPKPRADMWSEVISTRGKFEYYDYDYDEMKDEFVYKAIISSESSPTIVFIPNVPYKSSLYFCKAGIDKRWRRVKVQYVYCDIAIFKGDIYAMRTNGELHLVTGIIDDKSPSSITMVTRVEWLRKCKGYLIASSTDLLLVRRFHYKKSGYTRSFEVSKLDFTSKEWVKVTSLGDYSVCVGVNNAFIFSAMDYPGLRSECIYFYDKTGKYSDIDNPLPDKGIFSLNSLSVEELHSSKSNFALPHSFWLIGSNVINELTSASLGDIPSGSHPFEGFHWFEIPNTIRPFQGYGGDCVELYRLVVNQVDESQKFREILTDRGIIYQLGEDEEVKDIIGKPLLLSGPTRPHQGYDDRVIVQFGSWDWGWYLFHSMNDYFRISGSQHRPDEYDRVFVDKLHDEHTGSNATVMYELVFDSIEARLEFKFLDLGQDLQLIGGEISALHGDNPDTESLLQCFGEVDKIKGLVHNDYEEIETFNHGQFQPGDNLLLARSVLAVPLESSISVTVKLDYVLAGTMTTRGFKNTVKIPVPTHHCKIEEIIHPEFDDGFPGLSLVVYWYTDH